MNIDERTKGLSLRALKLEVMNRSVWRRLDLVTSGLRNTQNKRVEICDLSHFVNQRKPLVFGTT